MKTLEFDRLFDEGEEDLLAHLDLAQTKRSKHEQKRVNVDFPLWMIESLDREASRLGVRASRSSRFGWPSGWSTLHTDSPDPTDLT